MPTSTDASQTASLRLWDLPIRLFHWTLVVLIALSWWSVEQARMDLHLWSGYALLTLLVFRLLWGIFGSSTARFGQFVTGPRRVLTYLGGLARRSSTPTPGHNPAGGWVVMIMLLALLVQVGTGLFANDDIFTEGPLVHWVDKDLSGTLTGLHEDHFNLLLALIGLHIGAIVFYRLVKREDLARAMVTGRRPWPADRTPPPLYFAPWWLAALSLAGAAGGVWALLGGWGR